MIRAVLFDLDDTLFDHDHCTRFALDAVRSSNGCFVGVPAEAVVQTHTRILDEIHPEVVAGRIGLDAARAERFRRLFASVGERINDERAAAIAAAYRRGYEQSWREVGGAGALLRAVRGHGARVGVVSNNLLQEQQDKLRCCELDGYVDVLVVSGEEGVSKPDPRIFQIALHRLHCEPHEAVMIGDSWDADVVGAAAAGIRAVWFDRNRRGVLKDRTDGSVTTIHTLEPTADVLSVIFGESLRDRPAQRVSGNPEV